MFSLRIVIIFFLIFLILFIRTIPFQLRERMTSSIDVVIARYEEDVSWISTVFGPRYNSICYNKGKSHVAGSIPLQNVGRESHTFLHHIITNYDRLANITLFIPGSGHETHKMDKVKRVRDLVNQTKDTVFLHLRNSANRTDTYDFQIVSYVSTNKRNANANPNETLILSPMRPFGEWCMARFGKLPSLPLAYNSIFAVHARHIRQKPKSYYEKLIQELEAGSDLEVVHFFERAWHLVFEPFPETCYHQE